MKVTETFIVNSEPDTLVTITLDDHEMGTDLKVVRKSGKAEAEIAVLVDSRVSLIKFLSSAVAMLERPLVDADGGADPQEGKTETQRGAALKRTKAEPQGDQSKPEPQGDQSKPEPKRKPASVTGKLASKRPAGPSGRPILSLETKRLPLVDGLPTLDVVKPQIHFSGRALPRPADAKVAEEEADEEEDEETVAVPEPAPEAPKPAATLDRVPAAEVESVLNAIATLAERQEADAQSEPQADPQPPAVEPRPVDPMTSSGAAFWTTPVEEVDSLLDRDAAPPAATSKEASKKTAAEPVAPKRSPGSPPTVDWIKNLIRTNPTARTLTRDLLFQVLDSYGVVPKKSTTKPLLLARALELMQDE